MIDQFEFADILVQDCDELLALLPQLVQSILLFEDFRFGLSASSPLDRDDSLSQLVLFRVRVLARTGCCSCMHLLLVLQFSLSDLAGEHPELSVVEFALVVVKHAVGSVTYALLSVLCVVSINRAWLFVPRPCWTHLRG